MRGSLEEFLEELEGISGDALSQAREDLIRDGVTAKQLRDSAFTDAELEEVGIPEPVRARILAAGKATSPPPPDPPTVPRRAKSPAARARRGAR